MSKVERVSEGSDGGERRANRKLQVYSEVKVTKEKKKNIGSRKKSCSVEVAGKK